jgi:hypothetical protein
VGQRLASTPGAVNNITGASGGLSVRRSERRVSRRSRPARQHRACTPSRQARREIRIRAFGWKTQQLHLIMDNYAAHKHPKVRAWLAANPQDPYPLHPDLGIVAEPCRGAVRHHRTPSYPPGRVSLRPRPHDQDPGVHQRLEWTLPTLRLDKTAEEILTKPTVNNFSCGPLACGWLEAGLTLVRIGAGVAASIRHDHFILSLASSQQAATTEDLIKPLSASRVQVLDGVAVRRNPAAASPESIIDPQTGRPGMRITSFDGSGAELASTTSEVAEFLLGVTSGPHDGASVLELSAELVAPPGTPLLVGVRGIGE